MFRLFGGKKPAKSFDRTQCKPVLHCSICTGEQVAGFKDLQTGHFEDVMLIRTPKDLDTFLEQYGLTADDLEKDY
jgi:hypothetical protein